MMFPTSERSCRTGSIPTVNGREWAMQKNILYKHYYSDSREILILGAQPRTMIDAGDWPGPEACLDDKPEKPGEMSQQPCAETMNKKTQSSG